MPRDAEPRRLVVHPSRTKVVLLFVTALALVVAGLWIASPGMADRVARWQVLAAAWVGIPLFGWCAAYAAYQLARRRPAFTADARGFCDSASGVAVGTMRWEEIACVVPYVFAGQPMLGIWPKDVDGLVARQSWMKARLMRANVSLGGAPINIPQGMLPMSVVELAELIRSEYGVHVEVHL